MAPLLLVGTDRGVHRLDESGRWTSSLDGAEVRALAADAEGWWAVVGGSELWWGSPAFRWEHRASYEDGRLNCVFVSFVGVLAGADRARLLRVEDGRGLVEVESFQAADGRDEWYTPWGGPPDVRSLTEDSGDGTIYVNVHVGGVVRSRDGGSTWEPTMEIDADVHQVLAPPGSGVVLAASAWGLGGSNDGGGSWEFEDDGLHGRYLRSVALSDGTLFIGASEGHMGRRSAVYRRRGVRGPFRRCGAGLFEWFGSNIDTFCLVARDNQVAFGTEDGSVYRSEDEGDSWQQVASGLPPVRCGALL
jgi:hypothetical protein